MIQSSRPNIINLRTVDIKNWIKEPNNIYIGRSRRELSASKWANPHKVEYINGVSNRASVIQAYQKHIHQSKYLLDSLHELRGKTLGCWCSPLQCHGEVLHILAGNRPQYQFTEVSNNDNMTKNKRSSHNNSHVSTDAEDVNSIQTLLQRLEMIETSMKDHVTEQCNTLSVQLSAGIAENKDLIQRVNDTAQQAYELANDNSALIVGLTSRIVELENKNKTLDDQVDKLTKTQSTQAVQIAVLQQRLEDQICRNSRNSLIIKGVEEVENEKNWDDTRRVLCDALAPYVKVSSGDLSRMIERVHRGKQRKPNDDRPRVIHARLYDWNNVEMLKNRMWKDGKDSNIYIEQRYGPDTQYRRDKAMELRKQLKAAGRIGAGYVQYPAKLMVKQDPRDKNEKYKLHQDFSGIQVPLPTRAFDEE